MAQSSVRIDYPFIQSAHDERDHQSIRSLGAEILHPVEHLHRRFDDAYDRAERLRAIIHERKSRDLECITLLGLLKAAEAEKKAALAALRKARWLKVASIA